MKPAAFIVLGIGLVLLAAALAVGGNTLLFVSAAERTQATFKGAQTRNTPYGLMYFPQFAFTTKEGRAVLLKSPSGSSEQPYADGQNVPILYDPQHPEHARLDTLLGLWLTTLVLAPPALLLTLIGSLLLARSHRAAGPLAGYHPR